MDIVNNVKRKVPFSHLSAGDTFVKEDDYHLFMKTIPMVIDFNGAAGTHVNAIVLNDGAVTCLCDDDEVIAVVCEVHIVQEGF